MLHIVSVQIDPIEAQIDAFKILDQKIKALTAERDAIKKHLIATHFDNNPTYINANGQLLATYNEQIRVQLNQKLLQDNEPALYEQYSELKSVRVFLAK